MIPREWKEMGTVRVILVLLVTKAVRYSMAYVSMVQRVILLLESWSNNAMSFAIG